jgi:UDP-N-acetylmuramate dehydrogenase
MEKDQILALKKDFPQVVWLSQENMRKHTTFRIGGAAELFASPSVDQAVAVIAYCRKKQIPLTILGNGSNVLVGDRGIPGVVLSFGKAAGQIFISEGEPWQIRGQAGALLSQVARAAAEHGLTGLEFAAGIPGTLGGALLMNAGAYGGEMGQVVKEAKILLTDGSIVCWQREEMDLAYRHSRMMDMGGVILSVTMELQPGNPEEIQSRMLQYKNSRQQKQPLEFPSAGSTFKRPEGYFAGKLIMDAGLRGYSVGDAAVSEKHCGFVINKGEATAAQVRTLMEDVSGKVQEQFGVVLEPEVVFVGEF